MCQLLEQHVPSSRDREVVCRVLGWDGRGGCLLAEAGEEQGITRERARQVYDRAIEQIRGCQLSSTLDEILGIIQHRRNRAAEDIEADLQLRGFTKHRFHIAALCHTACTFGRSPRFIQEQTGGKDFIVTAPGVVRSVLKAALRSSTRYGLQTIEEISRAIPAGCRTMNDRVLVRQILATREDLRWLDADEHWFWLAAVPRNPVVSCVKKLLQFANPVSLADVSRATQRLPRKRSTPIPREALAGFCRQAPFCRITGDSIEPVGSLGSPKLLSDAESKVCRILERNGNELKFGCLETLAAAAGVSRPNLWRIVQYSPLIYRPAPRVYALVTPHQHQAATLKTRSA